ncbi:MAG: hypothetical protein NTW29_15235 [Bacteroidetes bacterium]|nr:hypothetical protein [Bacteroidota bacterium]
MNRSFSYLLVLFLLLSSSFGHSGFAANVRTTLPSVCKKNIKSPHSECKLAHGLLQLASLQQVQKSGNPGLPAALLTQCDKLLFTFFFKSAYSFPLVKKYLLFIYPSHHFW